MRFAFTARERHDLALSWILVSLAFAIFLTGLGITYGWLRIFAFSFGTAAVTVGLGFLCHELAHKWVANRHNCHAEYRSDKMMLVVSLALSPFHVFIAAPGAVHISGHANHEEMGRISLAGPLTNLILAALFFALFFLVPNEALARAAGLGTIINSSLALFNLLPFGMFDGAKIINWDKTAYGITLGLAAAATFFSFAIVQSKLGLF